MITQLVRLVLFLLVGSLSFTSHSPVQAQADEPICPPATSLIRGELVEQSIFSGDMRRRYYVYVPMRYDPQTPAPLVLAFHGFAQGALGLAGYSGWEAVADEHGFILVYPQGAGVIPRWESGLFGNTFSDVDDVGFTRDMIAQLSNSLCIDSSRIYANGFSNGGGMSYKLACELSDQITAMGGVAGAYSDLEAGCTPSRPVPVIVFHGTEDSIVPYAGGGVAMFDLPNIEAWTLAWAERNGCDLTPITLPQTGDVYGMRYGGCDDDADVVLYVVVKGGHTWPGATITRITDRFGGYITQDIKASEVMWAFFSQYMLKG